MLKRLRLLLLALLFFAPRVEAATTYYIATTGSDGAVCSIGAPCATFNHVVNSVMAPGDTLLARGGNYVENVVITASGTNWTTGSGAITVTNYPAEVPYIKPASGICALAFQNGSAVSYHIWTGINVDGINLTGPADPAVYIGHDANHIRFQSATVKNSYWTAIAVFQGPYIELISNVIIDGGRVGGTGGADASHGIYMTGFTGGVTGTDSHVLFDGNVIHGFNALSNDSGIQLYTGATDTNQVGGVTIRSNEIYSCGYGMFLGDAATVPLLVYNNLVHGNASSGIVLYTRAVGAKIYQNVVHGNADRGIEVGTGGAVTAALIKNNAITSNSGAPITVWNSAPSSYAAIQFNGVNGNGGSNTIVDMNSLSTIGSSITSAPSYTNAGASDFSLQAGSPYIDAGTTLADVPVDFLGTTRPQGGTYDIGAYEVQVSSVSGNTAGGGNAGAARSVRPRGR